MQIDSPLPGTEPRRDCPRCPRLVAFREACRAEYPDWWNAPVYAFGDPGGWLALAGLAPGKHGANRTGRPFTGDYAGALLFATLAEFGLSKGRYDARIDDGLTLDGAIIVNSVKCLPPQNKPTPAEIVQCRPYFEAQMAALPNVRVVIALGKIAHDAAVRAAGGRLAAFPFAHGAVHRLPDGRRLVDSYHCSRYNTNTGRLTPDMFADVFRAALALKDQTSGPNSSTSPR
ncbi:uracil-DNA glycosylase [Sphingopyxis sp. QXT-31]|uniref:uracil-DNA glycosylase n=1 Tax=Sphingopyxis sp. QXT-31 TaxID=1357916 RepID=UPI00097919F5|nr:uracil-DNA glycosylase [Sphingopyxis sp. QXT-31]APZ98178.1 uracil-DNA glycosylase [Sphingopyxis sp. QXT-31]